MESTEAVFKQLTVNPLQTSLEVIVLLVDHGHRDFDPQHFNILINLLKEGAPSVQNARPALVQGLKTALFKAFFAQTNEHVIKTLIELFLRNGKVRIISCFKVTLTTFPQAQMVLRCQHLLDLALRISQADIRGAAAEGISSHLVHQMHPEPGMRDVGVELKVKAGVETPAMRLGVYEAVLGAADTKGELKERLLQLRDRFLPSFYNGLNFLAKQQDELQTTMLQQLLPCTGNLARDMTHLLCSYLPSIDASYRTQVAAASSGPLSPYIAADLDVAPLVADRLRRLMLLAVEIDTHLPFAPSISSTIVSAGAKVGGALSVELYQLQQQGAVARDQHKVLASQRAIETRVGGLQKQVLQLDQQLNTAEADRKEGVKRIEEISSGLLESNQQLMQVLQTHLARTEQQQQQQQQQEFQQQLAEQIVHTVCQEVQKRLQVGSMPVWHSNNAGYGSPAGMFVSTPGQQDQQYAMP